MVGRNVNALGRLVITAAIVRILGASVFGEYALIVVWLTIAEWLLDFGTTEVFVREAGRAPARRNHLLRVFLALKLVQAPLAMVVLMLGLTVMRYSERILWAGLVSCGSLLFLAGVAYCRASFKAALRMEREVLAESASVITMLVLVLLLSRFRLDLMGLMGAHVVSRAVFLVGCLVQSRGLVQLSIANVTRFELKWATKASFTIGLIGFVVVLHNATDLLVLSRVVGLEEVAIYSGAQRFTVPLMMGMNAISVSFFPVLAFLSSKERFRETCQRAVDTTLLMGGFALVCLWCGADFFMGLLGEQFVQGVSVLRLLALMCSIKSVSLVIGPVLFLVQAENYALAYMCASLAAKVLVLSLVTPLYGAIGAAGGTLAVEALVLAPFTLFMVHRRTGFAPRISGALRIAAVAGAIILGTRAFVPGSGLFALAVAGLLYPAMVLLVGALRLQDLRTIMGRS